MSYFNVGDVIEINEYPEWFRGIRSRWLRKFCLRTRLAKQSPRAYTVTASFPGGFEFKRP